MYSRRSRGASAVIALIQRVSEASVRVDGAVVGAIGAGLLALVCAERGEMRGEPRDNPFRQ